MATWSQVSQNKRGRDEYWNGELDLPDAKRTNGGLSLAHDSDLMVFLDKIDNMGANICNPKETDVGINRVINSLEDEVGLKARTDYHIESTDEEDSSADQMGSNKQGELTAGRNSKATSLTSDIGYFTYYDDVRADLDFFLHQFTLDELGIIKNHIDGDSIPDIMYLDAVHSYVETRQVYLWDDDIWQWNEHSIIQNDLASPQPCCGFMWQNDIWQLNEHPVIQNDFASSQPEEFGINGAKFHDVWN